MASIRSVHFRNAYIYHVFNRGVERRTLFLSVRDRERFVQLLEYYRFTGITTCFSHYLNIPLQQRSSYIESMQSLPRAIDLLAYCLMPNHFHLLVRQQKDQGVTEAVS